MLKTFSSWVSTHFKPNIFLTELSHIAITCMRVCRRKSISTVRLCLTVASQWWWERKAVSGEAGEVRGQLRGYPNGTVDNFSVFSWPWDTVMLRFKSIGCPQHRGNIGKWGNLTVSPQFSPGSEARERRCPEMLGARKTKCAGVLYSTSSPLSECNAVDSGRCAPAAVSW